MSNGTAIEEHEPSCERHGTMELRPASKQTPEQVWCGTWYDCADPWCRNSTLLPSAELRTANGWDML